MQAQLRDEDLFESDEIGPGMRVYTMGSDGLRKRKERAPEQSAPELQIYNIGSLEGRFAEHVTHDQILSTVAGVARRTGASAIFADRFEGYANTSAFARHGLAFNIMNWRNETKSDGLARLSRWLRDGVLAIEQTPKGEALAVEPVPPGATEKRERE